VETLFSSNGYHRCVTSPTHESGKAKLFAPHAMRVPSEKVLWF